MAINEYAQYDALGLAELVRTKQVTANELLEEALLRVERHNPALNAVVFRDDTQSRSWATKTAHGPFEGVPLLLKDILALCEGMQLMAAKGEEALLLRLARQLEHVLPWASRRPGTPFSA